MRWPGRIKAGEVTNQMFPGLAKVDRRNSVSLEQTS